MGTVREGIGPKLDRRIAIEVLAPALGAVPASRERFFRGARAVAVPEGEEGIQSRTARVDAR